MTDFNIQGILYRTPGVEIGGVCKTSGDPAEPDLTEPGQGTIAPPEDTPATERPIPETTPGWGSNFGEEVTEAPSILAPVIHIHFLFLLTSMKNQDIKSYIKINSNTAIYKISLIPLISVQKLHFL